MMFIVLLGPPGAGKGTLAENLQGVLGLPHIATGNLLRQTVREQTPLGKQVAAYLERGELVPDETMSRVVAERLREPDVARGAIFDGYPRTREQAVALDKELAQIGADVASVIMLVMPAEALVQRLSSRRVCPNCGATYNLQTSPPTKPGICDRCGEELIRRADDAPEVVRHRLEVYEATIGPLEDYYERQNILHRVSANDTPAAVTAAALAAINWPSLITAHVVPVQPGVVLEPQ